ncbi:uncharacterized protein C2orf66 homolog [Tiliqua scincoides]|uniref:uncharacterized protein C2orf66 homolog n=1 Tax=Tiliqua scincoides TaxID=71010 RepID=UPI0034618FE8
MWKLVLLVHCATLILRGLGQGVPLSPKEAWKSLDNPRNRDLFFRTLKAYFSGRELDFKKVPDPVMVNSEKPGPIAFVSDPVASAFTHYAKKKNSYYK